MCVYLMMKYCRGWAGINDVNVHSREQNSKFVFSRFVHRMCPLKFMYSLFVINSSLKPEENFHVKFCAENPRAKETREATSQTCVCTGGGGGQKSGGGS